MKQLLALGLTVCVVGGAGTAAAFERPITLSATELDSVSAGAVDVSADASASAEGTLAAGTSANTATGASKGTSLSIGYAAARGSGWSVAGDQDAEASTAVAGDGAPFREYSFTINRNTKYFTSSSKYQVKIFRN